MIGWTIADIKRISPSMSMHRILLEEGSKPIRDAQRRLNPPMMEVVKNEILKLLNMGIIYPISDSKWASLMQVVPKKNQASQWSRMKRTSLCQPEFKLGGEFAMTIVN